MIKPLRKKHFQAWTALAVLLPAGIILSWLVIPNTAPVKIVAAPAVELLPVVQATRQTLSSCINLRSDAGKTNWQLEWKNKLPLTVPSAVIYQYNEEDLKSFNTAKSGLVGRIEATGDYTFALQNVAIDKKDLHVVVYDFIHNRIVDSIIFKTPRR